MHSDIKQLARKPRKSGTAEPALNPSPAAAQLLALR